MRTYCTWLLAAGLTLSGVGMTGCAGRADAGKSSATPTDGQIEAAWPWEPPVQMGQGDLPALRLGSAGMSGDGPAPAQPAAVSQVP